MAARRDVVEWVAMRENMSAVIDRVFGLSGELKILPALFTLGVVLGAGVVLSGCSSSGKQDPFAGVGSPMYTKAGPIPKGGGRRHIGKPYSVAGNKFYPKADPAYDEVGVASWYGPKFNKRMTSNGEWFDMDYRSAAHPTLPLPSYARVTNQANGRQLIVRINDRGPFVGTRIIDLSRQSAEVLGYKHTGTGTVRVQYIGPAPLNDQGTHLAAMNDELNRGTPLDQMIARADGTNPAGFAGQTPEFQTASVSMPGNTPFMAPSTSAAYAENPGGYFIQIAAFSDQNNAHRTQARLRDLGPVVITPVNGSIGTIYRVRMGPLSDESMARNVLTQVVDAGHHDARLVQISQY